MSSQGNYKVAVIDDNPDVIYMITEICKVKGWKVIPCADYLDVKKMLEGPPADIYLVDYHLPKVDGVEIVRMIRKIHKSIPILVLTVEERGAVMQRFMEAGADDYALKPIRAIDLISRIQVHLQHNKIVQYYTEAPKGISTSTLESVCKIMAENGDWMEAEQVAEVSKIALKSVYRYIKYMQDTHMVEVRSIYGQKVGRPRTEYKLYDAEKFKMK